MAIIATKQVKDGTSAKQDLDKFHRVYTKTFEVRATSDLTEWDIINDTGTPTIDGTTCHPQDTSCLATGKTCELKEMSKEGLVWRVKVTYDSKENPLQIQANPLLRPVLVEAQYQQINEPVIEDLSTPPVPVLNSAKEPFDSPLERQRALTRYTITKNYDFSTFNTNVLDLLCDTCNKNTWWGYAQFTCKMDGITWNTKIDQNFEYVEVKYTVVVDTVNLWNPVKVLDRGYREWVGTNTDGTPKMEQILDSHGAPITKPQLLDGAGLRLDPSDPPEYLDFKIYPPVDWSAVPTPP